MQIYIPISYGTRMTQNKIDSINSILLYGHVVDNNCCVVFSVSQIVQRKVATTYLAIRSKNS